MTPEARAAAIEKIMRVELAKDAGTAVAGFDLTFTVMKSVSTLWAVSDPKVQQVIFDAHAAAVGQAFGPAGGRGSRWGPARSACSSGEVGAIGGCAARSVSTSSSIVVAGSCGVRRDSGGRAILRTGRSRSRCSSDSRCGW